MRNGSFKRAPSFFRFGSEHTDTAGTKSGKSLTPCVAECKPLSENLSELITRVSAKHGVDPLLMRALVRHESGNNPCAARYEPRFFARYMQLQTRKTLVGHVPTKASLATELNFRSCSWGLSQVMGETARSMGFDAEFLNEITEPETNLNYGARYLKMMLDRTGGDVEAALLKYNGGANKEYPALVMAHYNSTG